MPSTFAYVAAAFVTGACIPLQLAFNAQLGAATRSPLTAGLIVFAIGTLALGALTLVLRQPLPEAGRLASAPPTIWLGGLLATLYILAVITVTPKLGVGSATVMILCGQVMTALVLDHFGAFGSQPLAINAWRIGGALLVILGVVAIRTH